MNALQYLVPESLVYSIGWTIIHSLWQAAAIALILALLQIVLRKNSSNTRYYAAVSGLLALLVMIGLTFTNLYSTASPKSSIYKNNAPVSVIVVQALQENLPPMEQTGSAWDKWAWAFEAFRLYFNQHMPLIVLGWLVGVAVLMLRFMGGLAYLQRLRHYRVKPASPLWQEKVAQIAQKLAVKRVVPLLESAVVQVPMVIGFLKPVILVPLGTLTGLSAQQVECILAHELAHIRRSDYLVNIAQSLVEIFLFFNPFVWWISGIIREERENCCDDIAIGLTQDNFNFAKTLTLIGEMQWQNPHMAVAFAGQRGSLLSRVKRLVQRPTRNATFSEGFWSACLLMGFLVLASFQANTQWESKKDKKTASNQAQNITTDEASDSQNKAVADAKDDPTQAKVTKVGLGDTIRFGKGFMLVTNKKGEVIVFKGGQLIDKDQYEAYQDEFVVDKNQVKIGKKGTDNLITVSIDTTRKLKNLAFFGGAMPPFPPMPPIVKNFKFDFQDDDGDILIMDDEDNVQQLIIKGKHINKKDLNKFSDVIESKKRKGKVIRIPKSKVMMPDLPDMPNIQIDMNEEEWEEYGKKMEEWGKKFEQDYGKKMEEYGKKMEVWGKEMENQAKNFAFSFDGVKGIVLNNPTKTLTEAQKKSFRDQLIADGLMDSQSTKFTLKATQGKLKINDKVVQAEMYDKYKKLIKDYLDIDMDSLDEDDNYSISIHLND